MMKAYNRAVLPLGFKANGVSCGIKKSKGLDLALFFSERPAKAACKFTTNKITAAPVKINKKYLKQSRYFRGIIVNSGNANCFTGKNGLRDAEETTEKLSGSLKVRKEEILVCSTGIIGKRLPLEKINKSIPRLAAGLSAYGINKAKQAILTTDKSPKEITVRFNAGNRVISICGVAKGAGMIAPNMATMLAFVFTDADITERALKKALGVSVGNSFNCITVDGCMSTNDSVILLANSAAKNDLIDKGKGFDAFLKALNIVCLELAKMIIKDAEGATKFIKIKVEGAKNFKEARKVALSIANSALFKTAVYAENPNFGRIVSAAGASGIGVKEENLKIKVSPLNKKCVDVNVFIKRGKSCATIYTSDLTCEYIKINAEYN